MGSSPAKAGNAPCAAPVAVAVASLRQRSRSGSRTQAATSAVAVAVSARSVVNAGGSASPGSASAATRVPAGTATSVCPGARWKVSGTRAARGGSRRTPMSSRNSTPCF